MDHSRTSSSDSALSASSSISTTSTASSCIRLLDSIPKFSIQEMPLRSMYTLNCSPPTHLDPASFSNNLMTQLSQLPTNPASLPPVFVISFLRKIFTPRLDLIDFCQALTGLDYLKDLECRRRREVAAAFDRLSIDRDVLALPPSALVAQRPSIAGWITRLEQQEHLTDSLYSSLYLGLRQWIMINEMSLTPFNMTNCHAMLNTLFPPLIYQGTNIQIAQDILEAQRHAFFRYIKAVNAQGVSVLNPLIQSSPEDPATTGWTAVHEVLEQYLEIAKTMIDECQAVNATDVSPAGAASVPLSVSNSPSASFTSLHSSIATPASSTIPSPIPSDPTSATHQSSFSVDSTCRPDTSSSRTSSSQHSVTGTAIHNQMPSAYTSPSKPSQESLLSQSGSRQRTTALGRFAREFRRITSSAKRLQVDEIITQPPPPSPVAAVTPFPEFPRTTPPPTAMSTKSSAFKGMSLRKMKSFGGLSDRLTTSGGSSMIEGISPAQTPEPFDAQLMQKQRLVWEKKNNGSTLAPPPSMR